MDEDDQQQETIEALKALIKQVHLDGGARCRLCGEWFGGEDLGEMLANLAKHGEEVHDA